MKQRKLRPEPPWWWTLDNDNCWFCKSRNNCNGCKLLKEHQSIEEKRRNRKQKQKIRNVNNEE